MRKLLLASAATMGALLVTVGGAQAQPVTQPAPGTIAVHLNGYLQFAIGDFGQLNTVKSRHQCRCWQPDKLNPVTTDGDARLYAGFDAQTLNGIDYGAQIELRTTSSDAGVGAGKAPAPAALPAPKSIYVKRAYGYLGTPQAGFVRLGQTDSAFTPVADRCDRRLRRRRAVEHRRRPHQRAAADRCRPEHLRLRRHLQPLCDRQDRLPVADHRRLQRRASATSRTRTA